MSTILIVILILFFTKIVRDSLFFVWLWQAKEYRIDRMRAHLKKNKNLLIDNLIYFFAIVISISYFIFLKNDLLFQYLVLFLFAFSFVQIIKEVKNKFFRRPRLTFKIVSIFSMMIVFYSLFFVIYLISAFAEMIISEIVILLLTVYLINPLIIFLSVLAVNPFFNYKKQKILRTATEKMSKQQRVKVIGITGSYGKTSTKEFLFTILSKRYKVIKTEGNNNTNIGVAYTVLKKVSDEFDYFICEMGAYKIGDIAEICDIVNPEIGILTGINEQHLELFGSIENTRKTKFELIEALPEDGVAIVNQGIKDYKPKTKVQDVRYFSFEHVKNIKLFQEYMEFDFQIVSNRHSELSNSEMKNLEIMRESAGSFTKTQDDRGSTKFRLNLLGKHYIENIISAIMVAEHLGMDLDEISKAVEKIKPTEYMMRRLNGLNDSVFIDDSYSANPDGVLAALDYLSEAYDGYQKIIVFPGIIELGNKSEEVHRKLFTRISEVCDTAYILNDDLKNTPLTPLKRGIKKDSCKFIFEKDFDKVAEVVKNDLDEKTVVLFESRGAGVVIGKLRK
ncbi:UDP-N-acetylmuramoyl-tripeptide--D-alanyl-D-alanine ligase [Candidatus Parcubacteria bacterium]|nr:UDP-N-acetylmuramoyl-tripeptide--D-alanyl-D-alanine ligase [Candidatus Parcubacteria bacterium]